MTNSKDTTANASGTSAESPVSLVSDQPRAAGSAQASVLNERVENAAEKPQALEVTSPSVDSKKKSSKGKVKFEAKLQRDEAVTYFRALVDGLGAGYLNFKQGSDSLELTPSSPLHVEVKGSAKGSRQKVSFEIEWELNGAATLQIQH